MEITNNAIQTLAQGQNVIFTDTVVPGNPSIIHRSQSGLVKLRGLTNCQNRARFRVYFSGNLAIPAGQTGIQQASVAISLDGEPINSTWMAITPFDTEQYFNVSSAVYIDVPAGCCATVGVENNGTIPVSVANANLIVERVA